MRFSIPILLFLSFILTLNCLAQVSGYYEIPDSGRPRSAFSLCCCKTESETNEQAFYSCQYLNEPGCPENTKQYKVSITECPSNLMFTKYSHE